MNAARTYVPSIIFAVLVHGIVIAALLANWDSTEAIEVTEVTPYYIEATVVSENPFTARAKKEAAEIAIREKARRDRATRERQAAIDRAKLEEEALAKQRADEALKEARELERLSQLQTESKKDDPADAASEELSEEERVRMEQSLALAVMDELEYRRAVTDDEKAMAYVAQIQRDIVQYWSRPPSARNGMEALLKVRLVPTGEVVDVAVVESSGNDAFDRSAILAVEKAERFVVPSESRQFERNFREFEVLFRPEDLRL